MCLLPNLQLMKVLHPVLLVTGTYDSELTTYYSAGSTGSFGTVGLGGVGIGTSVGTGSV